MADEILNFATKSVASYQHTPWISDVIRDVLKLLSSSRPNLCIGSNYLLNYFTITLKERYLCLKHFKSKNEACPELCFP